MMPALTRVLLVLAFGVYGYSFANAQSVPEDDIIGYKGASQVTFAANLSAISMPRVETLPSGQVRVSNSLTGMYFGNWDYGYFFTDHVVLSIGNSFNGMLNGPVGLKPSINVLGGALYYFSPDKDTSPYVGGKYQVAVSNRPEGDAGSALGTVGIQTVVKGRTSLFGELGYGGALKEFDSGVLQLNVGVRVRLF